MTSVATPHVTWYSPFGPPKVPPSFVEYGSIVDPTYKPFMIETALSGIEPTHEDILNYRVNFVILTVKYK